eukprot:3862079-Pyramimonas_sp.AAC.1
MASHNGAEIHKISVRNAKSPCLLNLPMRSQRGAVEVLKTSKYNREYARWSLAEAQSPRPFESIADAYAGMPHYQPSSDYVVPAFRQSRKDRMKVPPRPHPSLALTLPYLTPNLTSPYP